METKNMYIKKIVKTVIGAVVAGWVAYGLFGQDMMMTIAFAGLPTGWRVLSKVFGRWIITGNMMFVYLCIKMALSCLLGWIILPVDLVSDVVKLIKLRQT